MSSLIRECEKRKTDFFILHTNQHYSANLDKVFFEELKLPQPRYNLKVGSATHAIQTAKLLIGIEEVLLREAPDVAVVEGDTNTVLAGALAASKLHIKVAHIEAGLRSYSRRMPEEINRIITDHISDFLFAPTDKARSILLDEGIPQNKIYVTGNTVVDAVYQNLILAKKRSKILENYGLAKTKYFLVTVHREENANDKKRLIGILSGLKLVAKKYNFPAVCPIHPRTRKKIQEFKLTVDSAIRMINPVGYLDFLTLEVNAKLILTDSGGIQEESCILQIPCVTLRNNTERPETIEAGGNILAGVSPNGILDSVDKMLKKKKTWKHPFGNGLAGKTILDKLEEIKLL